MTPHLLKHPPLSRMMAMGLHHANMDRRKGLEAHEDALVAELLMYFLRAQKEAPGGLRHAPLLDFFAYCQLHRKDSHSQILQDLWVLHMTGGKPGGYFVEFGACDGHRLSNTLMLEQSHGWTGILAEPNPDWHEGLSLREASVSHACVAPRSGETLAFLCTDDEPELSRLRDIVPTDSHETEGRRRSAREIEVETISLADLLASHDAPRYIDYLSIDTEGSELEILKTFDFSHHSFGLITVEHGNEPTKREGLRRLLGKHGYTNWHPEMTRWDDWYVGPEFRADRSSAPLLHRPSPPETALHPANN